MNATGVSPGVPPEVPPVVPPVVRLAGDVARAFAHLAPDDAAQAVSGHLARFWEERLIDELVARVRAGEPGIDPLVVAAVRSLSA